MMNGCSKHNKLKNVVLILQLFKKQLETYQKSNVVCQYDY